MPVLVLVSPLLLLLHLTIAQESETGEVAEGVKCYTCGLEEVNPHVDKDGSYSNRVHLNEANEVVESGLRMYNHSCFEMNSRTGQDVPFILTWDILNQYMTTLDHTDAVMEKLNTMGRVTTEKGTYNYGYKLKPDGFKVYEDLYEELVIRLKENPCVPKKPDLPNPCQVSMPEWREFEGEVDKNYNMDMWVKQCDKGIVSCFEARGEWDGQLPTFRGCAGTTFPHDEKCAYEKQAVSIVEGKKSVDVGVSLCYCNKDICNLDTSPSTRLTPLLASLLAATTLARLL